MFWFPEEGRNKENLDHFLLFRRVKTRKEIMKSKNGGISDFAQNIHRCFNFCQSKNNVNKSSCIVATDQFLILSNII